MLGACGDGRLRRGGAVSGMAPEAKSDDSSAAGVKIEFPCESCGKPVIAELTHVGRRGRCPHCDAPVVVPFVRLPSGLSRTQAPLPPGAVTDEEARIVAAAESDRRHFVRFAVEDCLLRLARAGGHLSSHSFPVKDMSRGGVGFVVGATPGGGAGIEPGERVFVSVDGQAFPEPLELHGEVARVDPESENTYVVGVKLVEASVMDTDRIARLEESEQLRRRTRGEGG